MEMSERWRRTRADWAVQSYYQRFESAVALVLTALITLIIVVALYRLAATVIAGLLLGVLDPLDYGAFQTVFGEILTLLIALEFNHTLQYVVAREQSIIQTKVVLLIALLALALLTLRCAVIGNVRMLVDLASKTGAKTLAEGIETVEEYEAVKSLGVDLMQGYYIAHPHERLEAGDEEAARNVGAPVRGAARDDEVVG